MNAHLQKLTDALFDGSSADLFETHPAEGKGRARQFREPATTISTTEPDRLPDAQLRSTDKDKAAVERCARAGELMKILFPNGVHLTDGNDFAKYRLFDALVGTVAHFAQTGMVQENALSAISRYATLLERLNARSEP
jgi:hypothetical protein